MDGRELRKTVLEVVKEAGTRQNTALQSATILHESAKRLNIRGIEEQRALLAFFGDLFRIGYLAWGHDLLNSSPPFCHITDRGRIALAAVSRDPTNPDGYLANLQVSGSLNPVTESYIREALATYAAGCFKATAVMVGAAAESVVLQVRDSLAARHDELGKPRPSGLDDWRISRILDRLEALLAAQRASMPRQLFEAFEAYWPAFTQQVRVARNSAGHPTSVDPVEERTVQASLLIFPELIKLSTELGEWIVEGYS
jgi:hypothetical protein